MAAMWTPSKFGKYWEGFAMNCRALYAMSYRHSWENKKCEYQRFILRENKENDSTQDFQKHLLKHHPSPTVSTHREKVYKGKRWEGYDNRTINTSIQSS